MIELHYEDVESLPLDLDDVEVWLTKVTQLYKRTVGDVNYIFCSDEYLLGINVEHLKHDYYTDIITFDYCVEDTVSGDLFISVERVRDNSVNLNVDFLDELSRVMIHGVLHLCGLKDKSEDESAKMRVAENEALGMR